MRMVCEKEEWYEINDNELSCARRQKEIPNNRAFIAKTDPR